jgi:hypothetical protein
MQLQPCLPFSNCNSSSYNYGQTYALVAFVHDKGMKGALDDFKVMLTRNEPITGLAKVVAVLVIFALGVVAGLWVSAGVRRSQQESVDPRSTGFHGGGGGGICCRPEPNPDFEEFVAPTRLMHDMTDRELFWRATLVPTAAARYPFERVPKVAFMFLAGRGVLPLAPLWERFFRGAGHEERFSVYVHAPPGVAINVSADSPFYGRQIPSQVSDCRRTYAACMMSTTCSVNVSEDSRFVRLISCTSVLPAV